MGVSEYGWADFKGEPREPTHFGGNRLIKNLVVLEVF